MDFDKSVLKILEQDPILHVDNMHSHYLLTTACKSCKSSINYYSWLRGNSDNITYGLYSHMYGTLVDTQQLTTPNWIYEYSACTACYIF